MVRFPTINAKLHPQQNGPIVEKTLLHHKKSRNLNRSLTFLLILFLQPLHSGLSGDRRQFQH
jgi:hypothetical protein